MGHNANTLEQALQAVPFLAESLALTLAETVPDDRNQPNAVDFCKLLVPSWAGIDKE